MHECTWSGRGACSTAAEGRLTLPVHSSASQSPHGQGHQFDFDTFTALDVIRTKNTIRLAGIDAPEKRKALGQVSRRGLIEFVAGRSAAIEWVTGDRNQIRFQLAVQ
jgi:endonuclease YncB( thermonuclease family)